MKELLYFPNCNILIINLFAIAVLTGCEPEIITIKIPTYRECSAEPAPLYLPGDMIYGRVAGLKNCLPFLASAKAYIGDNANDFVGLEITTYEELNNLYIQKELLGIGAETSGLGTWELLLDSIPNLNFQSYSIIKNQNELEDSYKIDATYSYNRITITSIDSTARRIQGWFECRYTILNEIPSGLNPDTIIFTECHFEAMIFQ